MITSEARPPRDILGLLLRVPPSTVRSYAVSVGRLTFELEVERETLLRAVGTPDKPLALAEWRISYDSVSDRVTFRRPALPVTARPAVPAWSVAPAPRPAPAPIDPQKVGVAAREYQESERKAGRTISATDAVARVIAQQKGR